MITKLRKRYHEWRLREIIADLQHFERNLRCIGSRDDEFLLDATYLRVKIRALRHDRVYHENKLRSLS